MRRALALVALALGACGDDHAATPDAAPDAPIATPTARFAPAGTPMPFAAVPYPCDLYLSGGGGIQMAQLPTGSDVLVETTAAMNDALAQDHGFGLTTALFFGVDGVAALDPQALAQNVHLVDLANGSEVPLAQPALHVATSTIWAQPLFPLRANHAYGAWIEPALGLAQTAAFAAAKAEAAPSDPALLKAHDLLAPLWAPPAAIPREHAVAATVFRTHDVASGIARLKAASDALAPRAHDFDIHDSSTLDQQLGQPAASDNPGIDNPGVGTPFGVVHDHIAYLIHGSYDGPNYLSPNRAENGVMQFGAGGAPIAQASEAIRFTLVLPAGVSLADLPVVIFLYGLEQERHHAYAVANTLAAQGIATLAPELLFHGDRAAVVRDLKNNTSFASVPDGMGDCAGLTAALQFLAAAPQGAGTRTSDPLLVRDDLRQGVADVFTAVRAVKAGDWSALVADPRFSALRFRSDRVVILSETLGTSLGMTAAYFDAADVTALVGSQPSGGLFFPFMTDTPRYGSMLIPVFGNLFNIRSAEFDAHPERHPMLTIYQQLIEPGDALALLDGPVRQHTLLVQAYSDEVSANQAEELIEATMGIPALGGGLYRYQQLATGSLPATGNVSPGPLTVGVVQFMPATWDLFQRQSQYQEYMPDYPPFQIWPAPGMLITNPIVRVQTQMTAFVSSHFASGVPTIPQP